MQPFSVCATVYTPLVLTVIEVDVSPVLQSNVPVNPVAVNTELPQLFSTFTTGAGTDAVMGSAIPFITALVHPLTVCDTPYVPATATVIDGVISPVLHNKVPVYPTAVSTELPQLFTTETAGAEGTGLGAAVPLPGKPVQPFNV